MGLSELNCGSVLDFRRQDDVQYEYSMRGCSVPGTYLSCAKHDTRINIFSIVEVTSSMMMVTFPPFSFRSVPARFDCTHSWNVIEFAKTRELIPTSD